MKRRSYLYLTLAVLFAALTTGCTSTDVTVNATDLMAKITAQSVTGKEADDFFIAGQTSFALRLLQQELAASPDADALISPYSVMQALAMTANGADGNTLAQMEQVLGADMDTLNPYLYTQRLSQPNMETCRLLTANSIWFRDDASRIQVLPDFLQTNADYYDAAAYSADFDDKRSLEAINDWVKENTNDMIPTLLDEIPKDAVMYLINAVTFDAKWAVPYQFDTQIHDCVFTTADGSKTNVSMMYSEEQIYYEDAHAVGFRKSYDGGRYAFAALLPETGMSVTDYVAGLTAESLAEILAEPVSVKVNAGLPQFSCDYDTELSDSLKAMGMTDAFDYGADFSRIDNQKPELFINRVLHKTHIEVDTEGTRAAAVTAVEMFDEAAMIEPEETKTVILDGPFLYMILDTETNLPVFMGVMMHPQAD